jgi:hypothetical protein
MRTIETAGRYSLRVVRLRRYLASITIKPVGGILPSVFVIALGLFA